MYVKGKFTQDVGVPSTESSLILAGAMQMQHESAAAEMRADARMPDFRFDPNSTKEHGRYRLQDPQDFEIGSEFRKASGMRGVSLVVARNHITGDLSVMEIRFDREKFSELEAGRWWEVNGVRTACCICEHASDSPALQHRFDKKWRQADWDHLLALKSSME